MMNRLIALITIPLVLFSCTGTERSPREIKKQGTYLYDAEFLREHLKQITELTDSSGEGKVFVTGDYQGRVMTSTSAGNEGDSYGWINYELIRSGKFIPQFNPVGGEERFWIGPEGGQFSFYFAKGDSMNINHWQVPAFIDTLPFRLTQSGKRFVKYEADASISNYSGTKFQMHIERELRMEEKTAIESRLNINIPASVKTVAYQSINSITNSGVEPWSRNTGLVSIWLLAMLVPSNESVAIIPFKPVPGFREHISDSYFGKIPPERLIVKDSSLYFLCDGKMRSKLGLSSAIAKPVAASYDYSRNLLTMILFEIDPSGLYVNSLWEMQDDPFSGDVMNAYNDGPLANGNQLGPFYELESSSAARELKPGETQTYRQITCHLQGDHNTMKTLVMQSLGIDLDDAGSILPQSSTIRK